MRKLLIAKLVVGLSLAASTGAYAAGDVLAPKDVKWSFDGIFGTFDRASAQRGLQVYKDVCAGCHGLRLVSYRNIMDLGYTEDQVKAFAKEYEVQNAEPNDDGEMFNRPARPSDRFVSPFPNEQAARAGNNGAYPPDLSLITKARAHGPSYVYSMLTGYQKVPDGVEAQEGLNYNPYFPGNWIAMAPPLTDDAVEYGDGTKATVDQMAKDVTNFLSWAASPDLEKRKKTGLSVMMFLVVFTGLLIAVKKKVWANVH